MTRQAWGLSTLDDILDRIMEKGLVVNGCDLLTAMDENVPDNTTLSAEATKNHPLNFFPR